ncbi:MAG: hypothetical protein ACRYGP_31560 [Janthinobacterium lividum]
MMSMIAGASPFDTFLACMLMLIGCTVFGIISNAILRDTGFGVAVNGVLILLGTVLGACLRLAI